MKIEREVVTQYDFTDLSIDLRRPGGGPRRAVITRVCIQYTEFDNGDDPFLDYSMRGYECKKDGSVDKRQTRAGYLSYHCSVNKLVMLAELVSRIDDERIKAYIANDLAAATKRRDDEIAKLLND